MFTLSRVAWNGRSGIQTGLFWLPNKRGLCDTNACADQSAQGSWIRGGKAGKTLVIVAAINTLNVFFFLPPTHLGKVQ